MPESEYKITVRTIYGPTGQKGYSAINPEGEVIDIYSWPGEIRRMEHELGVRKDQLPELTGRPFKKVIINVSKPPPVPKRSNPRIKGQKIS
ncbi:MAG: hypothetical protein U9Q63_03290 [Patescibacteria group bacterium]|nr:hypothetical protein [Patescibacteria group bacterium]